MPVTVDEQKKISLNARRELQIAYSEGDIPGFTGEQFVRKIGLSAKSLLPGSELPS
jgi:hypothetical protein